VESEFRASPGYPQLRFGTSARHDGERFFLATQDQWGSSNAVSGRVFAFDPLPGPSLTVDDEEVSLQSGGSQRLSIQGCAESAGDLYLVLGSLSLAPDQACLPLDGHFLQLAIDPWFLASAQTPGQAPFLGTLGFLDPLARAQAEILIPPLADSPLVGSKLYHAALSIDLVQEVVSGTTVPSELLLSH
jgi:hypothetical protein